MAITLTPTYAKTLKEVAGNNGGIANTITFKAAGGTFAGDNGDVLGTVSGVPEGLNAVLVKTSATTAKLVLTGAATTHNNLADAAANGTADTTQVATLVKTTTGTASVAQVDTVTLSGQYEAGDKITLTNVATADVVYTVKAADIKASAAATAEAVSVALAAAINTAGTPTVTAAATAANGVLTLTAKTVNTALTTTAVAANRADDAPTAVSADADASGSKAVNTITLSGKYEAGDTITVSGIGGETIYTVVADDVKSDAAATLAAIATKLAAQITAGAGFTVTAATAAGVVTLTTKADAASLDATASATNANGGGLTVTFAAKDFATGTFTGTKLVVDDIDFDFADPAEAGTLSLVAPAGADTNAIYNAADLALATTKIEGTSSAEKVYIYNNGGTKPITGVTVTDGKWSLALSAIPKIKDGVYNLTASASNDGKGAMTAGFAFTVDTKAPAAPSVNAIKGAISDTTPVLSGKAEKGASVEVFADKVSLGKTVADAKGVWTLAVENTVLVNNGVDKKFAISAKATDAAGNATESKKDVDLIIDTTIATPTLEAATVAKKNTVGLSGKVDGETGGSLQLYGGEDGSLALGKAIKIAKDGTWKSSVKLTEGKHLLSVVAVDAAGNVSDNSALKEVTIDTFTATPTVELVKTGDVLTGLKGTAEAGATVTIKLGSATLTTKPVADGKGNWVLETVELPKVTKDTVLKITATAADTATNVSKASTAVDYTVKPAAADKDAPTYTSAAISGENKIVTLTFSEAVVNKLADTAALKAAVTFSAGGETFVALGANDTVAIVDGKLVVTFSSALTGTTNEIKVAANTLKDAAGNTLATAVNTDAVSAVAAGGTFTVTDASGTLTFGGTATGDITVTEASGALTFTRGGTAAETKPTITALDADGIPTTATLVMSKAVFTAIDAKLASAAVVTLSDATGTIAAADLAAIGDHTGTATLANNQTITGARTDVIAALGTEATKVVMAAGKVATVDLFADSTFTAAELTSVYGAVGGTVIGTAANNITVTALTGATVAATESVDTFQFLPGDVNVNITGFTSGIDKLNLNVLTGAETTTTEITGGLTTTDDKAYILTGRAAGAADSAAAAAAAITAGATWTSATATAYAIVVDDNSTAIYKWVDAAGTDGAQAGELTLVGTIAATTVVGDYVFAS